MNKRDYYEIMELHPQADHDMVVHAYWHLARKHKAAMDLDLRARRKLDELNEAFAVLGSPDERAAYDAARPSVKPAKRERKGEGKATKRVSIEVSYWRLPAWQGTVAATAALALAVLALLSGAHIIATLVLAVVAVAAALVPSIDDLKVPAPKPQPWSTAGEQEMRALELERSTAAIIARWRQGAEPDNGARSLAQLFAASADQRRPSARGRRRDPR